MALILCHECSKHISTNSTQCPHCGTTKIKAKTYDLRSKFLTRVWMFIMLGVFPLIFILSKNTDIFTMFAMWIFFAFILMMILLFIETVTNMIYSLFTGKDLYPDEKEQDEKKADD